MGFNKTEEKKDERYQDFTNYRFDYRKVTQKSSLERMILGLHKYINGPMYQGTQKPWEVLKKMEAKLEMLNKQI